MSKEIESVTKNLPTTTKNEELDGFMGEFYQKIKEK